ncbi:unnamed protein product [Rhizophagus irregularis]|nr:unnamed protein product [Rhizophagus irregularis]
MSANKFALNIGLFLDSTGSTNKSIDAIGVSVCAGTVDYHKTKIARDHKTNIKEYFQQIVIFYTYCIDFHSIKKKEVPMLTWLSTGHHMTTCICKQITSYPQIPITYNGASIYNPTNIDVYNINNRLIHKYYGIFDKSYTARKFE